MTYEKSFIQKLNEANDKRQKEWDANGDLDILFHALEFVGEAGELGNKVKKLYRASRGVKGSKVSLDDVKEEIADSLITLSKLVNEIEKFTGEKIDIEYETIKKFNSVSEKNGFDVKLDFEPNEDTVNTINEAVELAKKREIYYIPINTNDIGVLPEFDVDAAIKRINEIFDKKENENNRKIYHIDTTNITFDEYKQMMTSWEYVVSDTKNENDAWKEFIASQPKVKK